MGLGGSNSATEAATAADNARNTQIQQTVGQIQSAYNNPNRQNQIQDYQNNLQKYYTTQVNNQEATNGRNLKFAEARSGLTGGSADSDANATLGKDYSNAILQATQQAQGGGAALKQSDENSENQLISEAQAGNMTGSVAGQVSQAQTVGTQAAQNYGNANSLGALFGNTQGIYNNEATAAANRSAQNNPFGGIYNSKSAFGS